MTKTWINIALIACFAFSLMIALIDYVRGRSARRLIISIVALAIMGIALHFATGFPFLESRQAFGGGASPLLAVGLMFLGVVLGIVATYIFNLSGAFSWRDFARPLVASPIVLLPLIGSIQGAALEPIQLVCFAVLAFQNGFFWQQVLREAKPTT
jgi:dolichyl-phosphate-mannose--protein O-mannosyl transferase